MGAPLKPSSQPKDDLPADYYLATLGASSQRAMTSALNQLASLVSKNMATQASCPWWLWTAKHSHRVTLHLSQRYKPATVNRHLTASRGVLKASWHLGLMKEKAYRQAIAFSNLDVAVLPLSKSPLQTSTVKKLFQACAEDCARSSRDAAVIALLYGCGLRRQELAALEFGDYDSKTKSLQVLCGRGAEPRLVYPPEGTQKALNAWLKHRGNHAGPLFRRIRRGDHIQKDGMTAQSILLVVKNRAEQAGLGEITAHELRQSFISNLLNLGSPLGAVQQLAGHRNAQSTLRYDRTGERAKEEAARKLMVPFNRSPKEHGT